MAKTPAQAALDEVIGQALTPTLKADGYKKSAHTFRRTTDRCVQVLSVQASQYSGATELRFTINLGVYFPEVQAAMAGFLAWTPGPAGPTESECQVRARIGGLLPGGRDHWWTLRSAGPTAPVTAEVEAAFLQFGRPWLQAMTDLEAARRATDAVTSAGIALALGDRADAERILGAFVRGWPQATAVRDWAVSLGFAVPPPAAP